MVLESGTAFVVLPGGWHAISVEVGSAGDQCWLRVSDTPSSRLRVLENDTTYVPQHLHRGVCGLQTLMKHVQFQHTHMSRAEKDLQQTHMSRT
eukprot:484299-Amphidinium_carterae.1